MNKSRTLVITGIMILLICTLIGYWLYFSQNYPKNETILQESTVSCELMSEKLCKNNDKCKANYGPSQPMTTDIRFISCTNLSTEEYDILIKDKFLCKRTGGEWDTGCFCGGYREFSHDTGCPD